MAVAGRRRPRSASFPSLSSSAAVAEASASSQQQQPGNRRTAQRRTSGLSSSNRASKRRLEQLFYGQVGWLALPWWGATTTRVLDWTELDRTAASSRQRHIQARLNSTFLDYSLHLLPSCCGHEHGHTLYETDADISDGAFPSRRPLSEVTKCHVALLCLVLSHPVLCNAAQSNGPERLNELHVQYTSSTLSFLSLTHTCLSPPSFPSFPPFDSFFLTSIPTLP